MGEFVNSRGGGRSITEGGKRSFLRVYFGVKLAIGFFKIQFYYLATTKIKVN